MSDDSDIIELLENQLTEVERHAARLKAAIAALRQEHNGGLPTKQISPAAGVIPPIIDICQYLAEHREPVPQNDIIRYVGALRQKRYPSLTNHYSNVWRALEYHVRHNRLILCVDEQGREAKLKPLPHRPKGRKLPDSPALYEQDNWFVLQEETERDYAVRSRTNQHLFRQD